MKKIGCLEIAGFQFELNSACELPISLDVGFQHFISKEEKATDRTIIVHNEIIERPLHAFLAYEAKQENNLLWQIFQSDDLLFMELYKPDSHHIQQKATYSSKTKTWNVYCQAVTNDDEKQSLEPLAYPLAPLMWYYLTTEEDLIMIHASGISLNGKGRLFSGFSGVGKSTLAELWKKEGATVINDDRLLIRFMPDGSIRMYNTPMPFIDASKQAELQHIYLPFHSKENLYETLSGVKGLTHVMAFCIQHGYDQQAILHHMAVIEKLMNFCSIAKIGVVPTTEICSFLIQHEV